MEVGWDRRRHWRRRGTYSWLELFARLQHICEWRLNRSAFARENSRPSIGIDKVGLRSFFANLARGSLQQPSPCPKEFSWRMASQAKSLGSLTTLDPLRQSDNQTVKPITATIARLI